MSGNKVYGFLSFILIGLGVLIFFPLSSTNNTEVYADTNATDGINHQDVKEMTLGSETAPVEIIEYASLTCPHCRHFHEESFFKLKKDYIDSGKVKFIFREVYFDKYGLWAGMVARGGGSKRYFGLIDLIFNKQDEWTKGDVSEVVKKLERIGKISGLSGAEIQSCMQNNDKARALVESYKKNAVKDNVQSTPSFVVNGKLFSNMDYNELAEIIENNLN